MNFPDPGNSFMLSKFSGLQKGPAERGHVKKRQKSSKSFSTLSRHRQVTDLDVTVLGFSGPGLPFARQVLCGDAPRLFSIILVCI